MNAKDHKKLTKQIEAHLLSLGAVRTPERSYDWTLQTPLGELGITASETHYGKLVTIFCRFNPLESTPTLAMKRFPYEVRENGKWNFHFGDGCTVESAFTLFAADLAKTRDARAIALALAMAQWTPATPAA